jgi:hypothetical protein
MLEVTEIVTLDTQIVLEVAEIVMMGGCPDQLEVTKIVRTSYKLLTQC